MKDSKRKIKKFKKRKKNKIIKIIKKNFQYPCLESNQDPYGRDFKSRMSTNSITRVFLNL